MDEQTLQELTESVTLLTESVATLLQFTQQLSEQLADLRDEAYRWHRHECTYLGGLGEDTLTALGVPLVPELTRMQKLQKAGILQDKDLRQMWCPRITDEQAAKMVAELKAEGISLPWSPQETGVQDASN
jgi:hypothetical protein